MNEQLFNRIDLVVAPVLLAIVTAFIYRLRKKQPAGLKKYFVNSFFLRILGTFSFTVISQFYYASGDTYYYYYNAQLLKKLFFHDPGSWLQILFSNPNSGAEAISTYISNTNGIDLYTAAVFQNNQNATVSKIASVFDIVCFDSSLGIAIFFGLLSFLGCWYIFKTFTHIFPGYEKYFAFFCLYMPSMWFWGSGILKDPICIYAIGIIVYNYFIKRGSLFKRLTVISLASFLLLNIKPYIFYSFAVAASGGLVIYYFRRVNLFAKMASIAGLALMLGLLYPVIAETITSSFEDTIKESRLYITNYTEHVQQTAASIIPVFDPTPAGLAKLSITGLGTVYLRPFPWEINNVLYIFVILENLFLYYIIFKKIKLSPVPPLKNYRFLISFSIIFFLFLGMIIGVTTFNLGTIARYRVPGLPFLFGGIFCWKISAKIRRSVPA